MSCSASFEGVPETRPTLLPTLGAVGRCSDGEPSVAHSICDGTQSNGVPGFLALLGQGLASLGPPRTRCTAPRGVVSGRRVVQQALEESRESFVAKTPRNQLYFVLAAPCCASLRPGRRPWTAAPTGTGPASNLCVSLTVTSHRCQRSGARAAAAPPPAPLQPRPAALSGR